MRTCALKWHRCIMSSLDYLPEGSLQRIVVESVVDGRSLTGSWGGVGVPVPGTGTAQVEAQTPRDAARTDDVLAQCKDASDPAACEGDRAAANLGTPASHDRLFSPIVSYTLPSARPPAARISISLFPRPLSALRHHTSPCLTPTLLPAAPSRVPRRSVHVHVKTMIC